MARHKHADLMIAYAEDSSLEIEWFCEYEGVWYVTKNPEWNPLSKYRIKPKPHKWQHLIDIQKEHPETEFEMRHSGTEWNVVYHPTFCLPYAEYRVKPKSITLHQYVYKTFSGYFSVTQCLYKNIQEAKSAMSSYDVIGPAPWTAYTIEE